MSLRSSKRLKTTVELRFTTQKANADSPWTACSVFDWKYIFWVNLVQKLKIISLSWNFVTRLIQICRIPWWYSLFCFRLEIQFWANLIQKIKIVSLSWNFALDYAELYRKYVVFTFSVLDQKNTFRVNLVKKIEIVSLSWTLIPRLIWICRIQWWQNSMVMSILSALDWK